MKKTVFTTMFLWTLLACGQVSSSSVASSMTSTSLSASVTSTSVPSLSSTSVAMTSSLPSSSASSLLSSTSLVTTTSSVEPLYTLVYETGFESIGGFQSGTLSDNYAFRGTVGYQWGFIYGCVTRENALVGGQSMMLSWNPLNPSNLGYAFTNFYMVAPSRITFKAQGMNGLALEIKYLEKDKYLPISIGIFDLSEMMQDFQVELELTGELKFQFWIHVPEPMPEAISEIRLDDVQFYQKEVA